MTTKVDTVTSGFDCWVMISGSQKVFSGGSRTIEGVGVVTDTETCSRVVFDNKDVWMCVGNGSPTRVNANSIDVSGEVVFMKNSKRNVGSNGTRVSFVKRMI
ncbi:MAG: hypothetical protein WC069_01610 [Candidatus Shapirobacteria bacterium]